MKVLPVLLALISLCASARADNPTAAQWQGPRIPGDSIGYANTGSGNTIQDAGDSPDFYGAKGNGVICYDGIMAAASAVLTSNCATWTSADIGKPISVMGADTAGASLLTTIASLNSAHSINLATPAVTAVPLYNALTAQVQTVQSGGGSYVAADTITLAGGTCATAPVLKVAETGLTTAAVNAGGSNYAVGDTVALTPTGGTQLRPAVVKIATLSGSAAATVTVLIPGIFQGNPTAFAQSSTTGSGSGLTLNTLVYGANYQAPTTVGSCTVVPSNPVSQASTSGSGTGAKFTIAWQGGSFGIDGSGRYGGSGNFIYGTDDTLAFKAMGAAVSAGGTATGPKTIRFRPNAVYVVWGTNPANQDILVNIANQSGLTIYARGATIAALENVNSGNYFVLQINGSRDTRVIGLRGISAFLNIIEQTGVTWFSLGTSTNTRVENAYITGGNNGVACGREIPTTVFYPGLYVTGDFSHVGYPMSNQSDCPNTDFTISTNTAYRSYIGYNVSNIRGRIVSTDQYFGANHGFTDVAISCKGGAGYDVSNWQTTNYWIDYTNINSTAARTGSAQFEWETSNPSGGSGPCVLANIHYRLNVSYLNLYHPATNGFGNVSFKSNGTTEVLGDTAGNQANNITVEGRFQGITSGGDTFRVFNASLGFTGLATGTIWLDHLTNDNDPTSGTIGNGGTVHYVNTTMLKQSAPTLSGTGLAYYENAAFSSLTLDSSGSSSTTGAGTQTFTNSPCVGLTTARWVLVQLPGQTGTWYVPACQ